MPYDAVGFEIEAPVTVEPWRRVLLDAADLLEHVGWWGCGDRPSNDAKCVAMAIFSVLGSHNLSQAQRNFADYLGVTPVTGLFSWNDTPGRTAAEVTAALRACAMS